MLRLNCLTLERPEIIMIWIKLNKGLLFVLNMIKSARYYFDFSNKWIYDENTRNH